MDWALRVWVLITICRCLAHHWPVAWAKAESEREHGQELGDALGMDEVGVLEIEAA